jgi:cytochrome c oxidase assembly protein subunit 15
MKDKIKKLTSITFYLTTFVILWGALVRVTHSGAGCGKHWPLCDGKVIPLDPPIEMIIEFTHRLTSGTSGILVFLLFFLIKKHNRSSKSFKYIFLASCFMLVEILIGASLVLFGWVKDSHSPIRPYMMAFHLINSFLLIGNLFLLNNEENIGYKSRKINLIELSLLGCFLIVASMGAVTSLGDTLFPSVSLREGLAEDFSNTAPLLIQLRVIHPILAVLVSFFLLRYSIEASRIATRKSFSLNLIFFIVAQVLLGGLTVVLLAPPSLQILHLLMAIGLWCACLRLFMLEKS